MLFYQTQKQIYIHNNTTEQSDLSFAIPVLTLIRKSSTQYLPQHVTCAPFPSPEPNLYLWGL